MRLTCSVVRLLLCTFFTLISGCLAHGQMTAVTNATSTPIPGAGHDYIKMLSETVNPANGSVSLRLQTPVPAGRGPTIPFSFAYDSNGVEFPIPGQVLGQSTWGTTSTSWNSGGFTSHPELPDFNHAADKLPRCMPGNYGPRSPRR